MKKVGICIAVLGVDGAGKSTVIKLLSPLIEKKGFKVIHKHLRPNLIPKLISLKY